MAQMCRSLPNTWQPKYGVDILTLEERGFLFHFAHKLDVCFVIDPGPWFFDIHVLLAHELHRGEDPQTVSLQKVELWLQIHNLPSAYFTEPVGRALASFASHYLGYYEKKNKFFVNAFMRLLVALDMGKPLLQELPIVMHDGTEITCKYKYERLL